MFFKIPALPILIGLWGGTIYGGGNYVFSSIVTILLLLFVLKRKMKFY